MVRFRLSRMHVLYSFPHPLGKPGIGTIAAHHVVGLLRRGVKVTLDCTSLECDLEGDANVVETLAVLGRRVPHRAVGVDRAYRYHDHRVARAIRAGRVRPDLVHAWPRSSIQTFRVTAALGIPALREVPNTHTGYAFAAVAQETERIGLRPPKGHSHSFAPKILAREEAEYRYADLLLTPSDFVAQSFLDRGVPETKIARHRYGCDLDRFTPIDESRSTSGLRAIFVGSLEPRKGLHHALRAWMDSGACEDGRFVVCGSFVDGYREALGPLLDHPSIELHGFVSDPASLMRESDVFLFPSVEEGSALVTYEAQACGCVLLVSDATGARVRHGVGGLIHEAGDVLTLTSHLRSVRRDHELLRSLREATLATRESLSWDAAAAELIDIYESALGLTQPAE